MYATSPLTPGDEGYAPAEPVIRPLASASNSRNRFNWRANGATDWMRSRRGDGWTYARIAAALGVSRRHVTSVLRGGAAIETVTTVRAARKRNAAACARHLEALRRHGAEGAVGDQRHRRAMAARMRIIAARHPPPQAITINMRPAPGRALTVDPTSFICGAGE